MPHALLATAALGGAIYILIPGPAFLALLGIGAASGRSAGAHFVAGTLVGDLTWSALALVALIAVRRIGPLAFDVLGLVCGAYLFRLGAQALFGRGDGAAGGLATVRPFARGLAFGLTNPKGYPVALATFTALLGGAPGLLSFATLPLLLAAVGAGVVAADLILVLVAGSTPVRGFYRRFSHAITRVSGLLFIGFALHTLTGSLADLARPK